MPSIVSSPVDRLAGACRVPGDKSISHRALILGALAVGETRISGLLEGDDVMRTAAAVRAYGATVARTGADGWRVLGRGVGGLAEPGDVLDLGNSGTGVRLLMGLAAGHPFTSVFTGDASLRRRPMARVTQPLTAMGARVVGHSGDRLPLALTGSADLVPLVYRTPVPSAQVKSAILLAALQAPGETTVIEAQPTRDHTERLLRQFGATVATVATSDGQAVTLVGQPELSPSAVVVPGDPSSAAFVAVAAAITPGSDVLIQGIGVNPRRAALFDVLTAMGAHLTLTPVAGHAHGEPIADLRIRGGELEGVDVPPERAPDMIDEYPVLAVAAAFAAGTTRMHGVAELRVKESDRLGTMARGLAACGVVVEEGRDSLTVHGRGRPQGGARIDADLDHRIAMSFLVMGLRARAPVAVAGADTIATSFPGFVDLMNRLGAGMSDAPA
ncbi:MAG: 3-phosphoshikimate 1-carboxyvinyltransferase [Alphaproteobacteria bacterium]|nr:3-phosphoshikimate 1-carboxyvinyltransferase [Alphaproteobacteria bacterium]